MDEEPILHQRLSPARIRRLRALGPEGRLRLGASLTDTALHFARQGRKKVWQPTHSKRS